MNHGDGDGDSFLPQKNPEEEFELPPGFRFHPTDEELITHYLSNKALDSSFEASAIAEADLNKCEPWDLPERSKLGEKESYFFCVRGRKYPTGLRTNRATEAGYWKATGKDREIRREKMLVGMKKTLVFYIGRAPRGDKTDWIMHEYRLEGSYADNDWVICRVFKKNSAGSGRRDSGLGKIASWSSSFEGEVIRGAPLPPLMDDAHVPCFSDSVLQEAGFDCSVGASSSFYGVGDESGLSAAMDAGIFSDDEVGRISSEERLWNC